MANPQITPKAVGPPSAAMISATDSMAGDTLRLMRSRCQRTTRNAMCEATFMDSIAERLQYLRKKAGFETYEQVKLDELDLAAVNLKRVRAAAAPGAPPPAR